MGFLTCAVVILLPSMLHAQQPSAEAVKSHYKKAICLTHQESTEVYLSCKEGGLINLISVQYGFQEIPLDDRVACSYVESASCLRPLSEIGYVRAQCMAMRECRFLINVVYLADCGRDSSFVQTEYQCIPGNTVNAGNVIDICGDSLNGEMMTREEGYIKSLNYPNSYPSNQMCTCSIKAHNNASQVTFEVLDENLHSSDFDAKASDWLEYTTDSQRWGAGNVIDTYDSMAEIQTGSSHVVLNFRSDAKGEGRGFWLKYSAKTPDGQSSALDITCEEYTPKDYRSSIVCFDSESVSDSNSENNLVQSNKIANQNFEQRLEIYLSCAHYGVINILYAEHGYDPAFSSRTRTCAPTRARTCTRAATAQYGLLESCMGQAECRVMVDVQTIPSCSHDSNYFQVEYQCIPDDDQDTQNIMDVCGDKTYGRTVVNYVGYIESLGYPRTYTSGIECSCRLQADSADAEIILTLLDSDLSGDRAPTQGRDAPMASEDCKGDALEVRGEGSSEGVVLCQQPVGEPVHTGSREITLQLHADSKQPKGRGFWLKYYGRRPDGSKTAVQTTCTGHVPKVVMETGVTSSQGGSSSGPSYGKPTHPVAEVSPEVWAVHENTRQQLHEVYVDLIISLAVLASVMLGLLALLIFLKYKRLQRMKNGGPAPQVPLRCSLSQCTLSPQAGSVRSSAMLTSYGSTYSTDVLDSDPVPPRERPVQCQQHNSIEVPTACVAQVSSMVETPATLCSNKCPKIDRTSQCIHEQHLAQCTHISTNSQLPITSSTRQSSNNANSTQRFLQPGDYASTKRDFIKSVATGHCNPNFDFANEPLPDYGQNESFSAEPQRSIVVGFAKAKDVPRNPLFDANDSGYVCNEYFYNL